MHIAVDARELTGKPTGVGTYLTELLRQWEGMPDAAAHRWTFYVPGDRVTGSGHGTSVCGLLRASECRTLDGDGGTWWEQRSLASALRHDRPDVVFAPGYTAPLAVAIPVVLAIHDLSFMAHPEWFSWREGFRRRVLTRWSARRARVILTDSEFSRGEIVNRIGVPPERVRTIHLGAARTITPAPPGPRAQVVLYVGSIFNRRRVPDLIHAFALMSRKVPDARLEIVGENRTHPRQDLEALVDTLGISRLVNLRSYVSDEDLRSLYGRARVFAFLSEYEGFGFTPLEALAHSVPIVVLDTPVAHEIYGDAAVYVPAGDAAATACALERLMLDDALRSRQLQHGGSALERYCWPDAARRTLQAIAEAGARG